MSKSALETYSTAADSAITLTTTMTNYASQAFTPALGRRLPPRLERRDERQHARTPPLVQAKLNGAARDDAHPQDQGQLPTMVAVRQLQARQPPRQLPDDGVAAAKENGSSATHNIRRARVTAIRLSGSRFAGYQFAASDGAVTTTARRRSRTSSPSPGASARPATG